MHWGARGTAGVPRKEHQPHVFQQPNLLGEEQQEGSVG